MLNLYDFAVERARGSAQRRELPAVAAASGVDYSWLSKFARGKIPGASYKMVRKVSEYYLAKDASQGPDDGLPPEMKGRAA